MKTEIKKQYISKINRIFEDLKNTDLLDKLDEIDAQITINYFDEIDQEWSFVRNETRLGYIYKKRFFDNPEAIHSIKTSKTKKVSSSDYLYYLKSIATSLYSYSIEDDIFNDLAEFMVNNQNYISFNEDKHHWNNYIEFYIDSILILSIMNYDEPDGAEIEFDLVKIEKDYQDLQIKTISPLSKTSIEQPWFKYLNEQSQKLILAGENLIAKSNIKTENDGTVYYDLSCFLLPFIKAIECEIPYLIERYLFKIIDLSNEIIHRTNKIESKKTTKKYNPLINISKHIIENQSKVDRINSISNLYYIIHYFGFVENLDLIENAKSAFEPNIIEHLRKEKRIIEELKLLGEDRNNFIHAELITQLNVFRLHYDKLYLILEFLAMFKQLSKQTN